MTTTTTAETTANKRDLKWFWREWVRPMLVMGFVLGSFRSAVADWNDVPTGSMKPTILEGDRVFVNKLAYDLKVPFTSWRLARWSEPQRGQIVVFFSPRDEKRLVKRVIGLPGERIQMRNRLLFVNGVAMPQVRLDAADLDAAALDGAVPSTEALGAREHPVLANLARPSMTSFGPVTVPEGSYLMMGDNRDNSFDSRYFGFVTRDRIVGEATGVALSIDWDRHRARWERFFTKLS
ncbi:MAG: signal peptidase I [Vicinamibacteria bacterium]